MNAFDDPHSPQAPGRVLGFHEVRTALQAMPGWTPVRTRRALRHEWQFNGKRDAAAFVFMATAVSFTQGVFPDLTWFGRSVVCILTDPEVEAITPRLLELAQSLTIAAGPIVGNHAQPKTDWVQLLVDQTASELAGPPTALSLQGEGPK